MRLAALFSGGKDSTFAIMQAMKQGHRVTHLVTVFPEREDSYMFHYPCIEFTVLQAQAMGVEHVRVDTSGEKEIELEDLKKALSALRGKVDGVLSGAVSSEYQKSRIDRICAEIGLESVSPLWGKKAADILRAEVEAGLEIFITAVATDALNESWLGRRLDEQTLRELDVLASRKLFNVQFEGGEAETLVTDCPFFKKRLQLGRFEKLWDPKTSSGRLVVKGASLEPKRI